MNHVSRKHRRSIRLPEHDYTASGVYFVTVCVQGGECLLGEIVEDEMRMNDFGLVVAESWLWLAEQYAYVALDEWVVMPNHLHGVIILQKERPCRGGSRTAPTRTASTKRKPLGRLIGAFKTVSTKHINQGRGTPGVRFWQRNYYERVVRNERELSAIRKYILQNPLRWALDRENPA